MFNGKTVFVLGAGASWHYGYPTGERLVADVINCTKRVSQYYTMRLRTNFNLREYPRILSFLPGEFPADRPEVRWNAGIGQCVDLINRLESVSPLVIDYFLGWNSHLEDFGRTMIAFALLEREAHGAGLTNYNRWLDLQAGPAGRVPFDYSNYRDNWVRFIVHQLLIDARDSSLLAKNNVHFVTFNYDKSLEIVLSRALRGANFLQEKDIADFLKAPRILHMYGALNDAKLSLEDIEALKTQPTTTTSLTVGAANRLLDNCFDAGKHLRVIDPHNKDVGPEGDKARELLRAAEKVYFLGFGFDANNLNSAWLAWR